MLIGSEKTPQFTFLASSIKFTSGVITPAATLIGEEVFIDRNHAGSGKSPLCSGASQFAAGYAADWL